MKVFHTKTIDGAVASRDVESKTFPSLFLEARAALERAWNAGVLFADKGRHASTGNF